MKKELRTLSVNSVDYTLLKKIHEESFPTSEYPDLNELMVKWNNSCFCGAFLDDVPVGTMYFLFVEEFIYLVYIAINKRKRRQGIGSWMLQEIKKKYKNYTVVVDMPIYEEKESLNKEDFYLNNGFNKTDYYLEYETTGEISRVYSTDIVSRKMLDELIAVANRTSDTSRIFLIDKKEKDNA